MKKTAVICILILVPIFVIALHQKEFPKLSGPYLGQNPPGMKAEVFAPGIVSTKMNEVLFGFFNSGKIFLFSRTDPDFDDWRNEPIYIMELKKDIWTKPRLSKYIGESRYLNLPPLPQGKTLYFARWGEGSGKVDPKNLDIWEVKSTGTGWSAPTRMNPPINSETIDTCPSVSGNGTLYFFSGRRGGIGRDDIYLSRLINGKHNTVKNLGPAVNSKYYDIDPFIAPDESYLIFCSNRPGGCGEVDMYVSFHKNDGSWTSAVNLGKKVNSSAYDWIPFISEDGKYLFFTSNRTGNYDIYWVDIKVIDRKKQQVIK